MGPRCLAVLAAVSFLARYSGRTHVMYTSQLKRWFAWCEGNGLDPLIGIKRAHVELYIRHLGECGLMDSSIVTMMHGVRGYFRFAHIDGLITADPAVYARLPMVQRDESRTQGLDRLELIRFLQVAQTLTVHHGALAFLLGINALRVGSRRGAGGGLRRHIARAPGAAPGRQGPQAGHHSAHGPRTAGPGGLPGPAHQWAGGPAAGLRETGRPARRVPDGRPDRQGRSDPPAHQPPLAAPVESACDSHRTGLSTVTAVVAWLGRVQGLGIWFPR